MYSYSEFALTFKAISDETRLKILDMLSCGELCACDILTNVNISQSTLSYHMKILTDSGLVNGVKDGSWMRYSLNNERLALIITFLSELTSEKKDCICQKNSCEESKTDANKY